VCVCVCVCVYTLKHTMTYICTHKLFLDSFTYLFIHLQVKRLAMQSTNNNNI
jgi:hypothetical protein